ncbi:DUF4402 domain-containing protein [Phenylobacterium sp. VNQ135]|uniref:DUF4402 domain-containing protein n=1 Tax=Phenylobacterium sp. VNQ135 TaxID=3400922 RepID=UPI003BFFBA6C
MRSLLIAAAAVSAIAGSAAAQTSDSKTVDAKVKFITALSLAAGSPLNYGTLIRPTSAGTVVIDTDAARSGDPTTVADTANAPTAASFTITAEAGQSIQLALAQDSMTSNYALSAFTVAAVAGGSCGTVTTTSVAITGTGSQSCTFKVGATLGYPANPTANGNVGKLKATVNYQ